MLLNQDQDLLADLSIAICSSLQWEKVSFTGKLVPHKVCFCSIIFNCTKEFCGNPCYCANQVLCGIRPCSLLAYQQASTIGSSSHRKVYKGPSLRIYMKETSVGSFENQNEGILTEIYLSILSYLTGNF